jgi:hypothetical protein
MPAALAEMIPVFLSEGSFREVIGQQEPLSSLPQTTIAMYQL